MALLKSLSCVVRQLRRGVAFNSPASKLVYREYGDPVKVVAMVEATIPQVQPNQLLVRMIAAPVNPADINTIEGKYPSKPTLPAIPGNEGVGEVIEIGSQVTNFRVGDHVVPLNTMMGTWQSHTILENTQALKVPKELGVIEACTLTVNPCTAYRMLKDFVKLQPGDVVVQNGANSAVGQNVIQLCRIWGLKSVNIVRDRPNLRDLRDFLTKLGASVVLTEEEVRTTKLFRSKELPKPKLALNCVGGKNATDMMRLLDNRGTVVTYGGMSREPLTVGTAMLIFKDLHVRGFWMTEWSKRNHNTPTRKAMFEELVGYMLSKQLIGPASKLVDFDNYKEALSNTLTLHGMTGQKFILNFNRRTDQ